MLKILTVIESLGRAGAEQALVNLLPALQKRGHQCEVVALWPPYTLATALEEQGIIVHRFNLRHRWSVLECHRKLFTLCRRRRFDILHAHLFFPTIYSALTKIAMPELGRVVSFHNLGYDSYPANRIWKRARKAGHACLVRHWIDTYAAVSPQVASHYEMHLGLTDVKVISNSFPLDTISLDEFPDPATARRTYSVGEKEFLVLTPGRLVREKGHLFLLQALEILRTRGLYPKVLILGDGPLAVALADEVLQRNLSDQVIFHKAVPYKDVLLLIRSADAVTVPSIHEGFGLVAMEAMALERAVLATDVGGLVDLVDNNVSGLLVPPANSSALAEGLEKLMRDPILRQRLGRAGREKIVSNFSTDIIATRWENLYREMLEKSK